MLVTPGKGDRYTGQTIAFCGHHFRPIELNFTPDQIVDDLRVKPTTVPALEEVS